MDQRIRFGVARDGVRLAYAIHGSGTPVVWAAHWMTHLEHDWESPVWRHWLESLGAVHTVIRYDDRGCGLSDREVGDLSLEAWVGDLGTVVDSAGFERFALLGVSHGGPIAIAYAVSHPERVSHLVLWGSYVRGRRKRESETAQAESELLCSLIRVGWGRSNPVFRRVFTSLFIPGGGPAQMDWFDELQRVSTSPETAARLRRARDEIDVTDHTKRVRVPTLVMHARDDASVPFSEGRLAASLIPDAHFVPLPGRNHILLADEPAWPQFLQETETFLSSYRTEIRSGVAEPRRDSAGRRPARRRVELPVQPTPLIGRGEDLAELRHFLSEPNVRLVTLTGAPGAGKTRLAVEAAAQCASMFDYGVFFVDLSAIRDPELVIPLMAHSVGVEDAGGKPLVERLQAFLRPRSVLLLLDNFEQVLPAAAPLADLLAGCSRLKLLVTSRESLHLSRWEHEYEVLPLPTSGADPTSPEIPSRAPAVALFVERSRARDHSFTLNRENTRSVTEICSQLDGLPLAIELAAAQIKALSPEAIASRLRTRSGVMASPGRDMPARQRNLSDAIAWSYELLSDPQQRLFRSLAPLAGGFSLEAAEAACGASLRPHEVSDALIALVDKSLVAIEQPRAHGRYRLLETIRAYAMDRLMEAGEEAAVRRLLALHFALLVEEASAHLQKPDQTTWLDRLQADHQNLRAALQWSLDPGGELDLGLRMGGSLWRYWLMRGHLAEGRGQLEELLAAAARGPTEQLWEARYAAGVLAFRQGDYAAARAHLESYRQAADSRDDSAGLAAANLSLGRMAIDQGQFDEASALLEESLRIERRLGQPIRIAWSLSYLGLLAHFKGDSVKARSLLLESLPLFQELGDHAGVAVTLFYLGLVAYSQQEEREAHFRWSESMRICSAVRYLWPVPYLLEGFGALAARIGEPVLALQLAGAADSVHEAIGAPLPPVWERRFRLWLRDTRRLVSPAEADAAWEAGRVLGREEAMELTLAVPAAELLHHEAWPSLPAPPELNRLTRREQDVAALLARGLTNREIANELGIAEGTARIHVERILGKLYLRSRAQFVAWAAEKGMIAASRS